MKDNGEKAVHEHIFDRLKQIQDSATFHEQRNYEAHRNIIARMWWMLGVILAALMSLLGFLWPGP